jgi:hypothetical protein
MLLCMSFLIRVKQDNGGNRKHLFEDTVERNSFQYMWLAESFSEINAKIKIQWKSAALPYSSHYFFLIRLSVLLIPSFILLCIFPSCTLLYSYTKFTFLSSILFCFIISFQDFFQFHSLFFFWFQTFFRLVNHSVCEDDYLKITVYMVTWEQAHTWVRTNTKYILLYVWERYDFFILLKTWSLNFMNNYNLRNSQNHEIFSACFYC